MCMDGRILSGKSQVLLIFVFSETSISLVEIIAMKTALLSGVWSQFLTDRDLKYGFSVATYESLR